MGIIICGLVAVTGREEVLTRNSFICGKRQAFFVQKMNRSTLEPKELMVKHWKYLSGAFNIEDAVGPPSGKISEEGMVDFNQSSSNNFSIQEVTTSTRKKSEQASTDHAIRLIEAKTRLYITCIVLAALILLIVCSFVAFLLRDDSNFLSAILGLVETSVGGIMGYFFGKWEKRKD